MRGWRGRIGTVSPTYCDNAQDWLKPLPEGVNVVFATLGVEEHTPKEFQQAREVVGRAARGLIRSGVDVLILGGTPLVTLDKGDGTSGLAQELEKESGVPTTTSQDAAVLALRSLEIKRLLLATPYKESLNEGLKRYLEKIGFQVLAVKSALCAGPKEIGQLAPETPYRLAEEAFREHPQADGVYIPNTKWETMEVIAPLERELKIPVVTSIQASLWWALKTMQVKEVRPGYGRLLENLPQEKGAAHDRV